MSFLFGGDMNDKNLIPFNERSESESRELGSKGGIASGKARREKKQLQEALKKLLKGKYDVDGEKLNGYDAMAMSMIKVVLGKGKGAVMAFNSIRDTIGEKPEDKVTIENENLDGINITFVDKSKPRQGEEVDPPIVGDYTSPTNTEE